MKEGRRSRQGEVLQSSMSSEGSRTTFEGIRWRRVSSPGRRVTFGGQRLRLTDDSGGPWPSRDCSSDQSLSRMERSTRGYQALTLGKTVEETGLGLRAVQLDGALRSNGLQKPSIMLKRIKIETKSNDHLNAIRRRGSCQLRFDSELPSSKLFE